jgi:hypothetical protein
VPIAMLTAASAKIAKGTAWLPRLTLSTFPV